MFQSVERAMEAGRQRQFHIHHCLGRGGYGEVYRATMVAPGGIENDVAVKLLRVDLDPGAEAVRRLRDEGHLLSVLRHPAILRVFDLALLDGRVGLVTEYIEGEDLSTLVGVLPLASSIEVIGAVAEALDAAWNHPRSDGRPLHLVHRDIKPSNIRIGRHGEVKVLDFGIARSMDDTSGRLAHTGTGSTVGSLAYMAPERFARAPFTPAGDVFGLGCTLYECLAALAGTPTPRGSPSGSRVFDDPVPVEMFRLAADERHYQQHLDKAMVRLDPDLDLDLVALLREMLAYAPTARPSPAEVEQRCIAIAARLGGPTLRTWARERIWPARSPVSGHLEGRVITEGTLSPPTESGSVGPFDERSSDTVRIDFDTEVLPKEAEREALAPRRSIVRRSWIGLLIVAPLLTLLAYGATLVGAPPTHTPIERVEPLEVEPELIPPDPVPRELVAPAPAVVPHEVVPEVVPEVVAPAPTPRVNPPSPRPEPSLPPPAPAPVLPEPPRYGQLTVFPSNVRVELHAPGKVLGPGKIPTGRYELHADFGYGLRSLGSYVDIIEGYETTVRCNTLRHQCDVDR